VSALARFDAGWLQRREPFDAAARRTAATRLHLSDRLARLRRGVDRPWRVIDLACGTGANLRWLAPQLGGTQQWLVVDHDEALLRQWPGADGTPAGVLHEPLPWQGPGFEVTVVRCPLDLARQLDALPWAAADLVTASALLDLVSHAWLQQLVAAVTAAGTALLLALTVDGRHQWRPGDPADGQVGTLFAAHQRRDKGFGPALGPQAGAALRDLLRQAGYRVHMARSDWWLDGAEDARAPALLRELILGMAAAARDQAPAAATRVNAWMSRRLALAAQASLCVGHVDLLALPARA
jgi:SAM-dependent methyltransferase